MGHVARPAAESGPVRLSLKPLMGRPGANGAVRTVWVSGGATFGTFVSPETEFSSCSPSLGGTFVSRRTVSRLTPRISAACRFDNPSPTVNTATAWRRPNSLRVRGCQTARRLKCWALATTR